MSKKEKSAGEPLSKAKTKAKTKTGAEADASVVDTVARAAGWVAGVLDIDVALTPTRDLFDSIQARRSHKRFKPKPVEPDQIRVLLDAAVTAPNHKLTEPWGFVVLGPRAQRAYADSKARLRFGESAEGEGKAKAEQMIADLLAVPAVVGVTQKLDADPVRREEDYAAVFMAVENLLLAATALGLGSKLNTGNILEDVIFRSALGLPEGERLVTVVHLGEPAEEVPAKKRAMASEKTRWLD